MTRSNGESNTTVIFEIKNFYFLETFQVYRKIEKKVQNGFYFKLVP